MAGALAAVVAPAAVLHGSTAADRLAAGLTAAPFGWPRLLVAHLAAAVPLGFVLAGRAYYRPAGGRPAEQLYGWVAAAVAATGFAVLAVPALADALDAAEAGFLVRTLVRSALSAALVTPWIGVALALAGAAGPSSQWQLAAAVVLATVPPGVYAERLVEVRSARLATVMSTGRIVRARGILDGLIDLAGDPTAAERRRKFDYDIDGLTKSVTRELSSAAPASARLNRAIAFIQLDRTAEAEALLAPLAASDPTAGLLLGAVYRDQQQWTDAERIYQQVLDLLRPQAERNPRAAEGCVAAYDGLAEAQRGLDRPEDVARTYREALDRLPGKQGYFHLQIGVHEANQGRSAAALESFAEAVRLDPKLEPQAAPHVRRLRNSTPSCFTFRSSDRP